MNKYSVFGKAVKKLIKYFIIGEVLKKLIAKRYFIISAGAVVFLIFLIVLGTVGYLLFTGPRMKEQPNIKTYEQIFSPMPAGTVFTKPVMGFPAPGETNPLKSSKENLEKGKIYYGYYCAFCHGSDGKSQGHVADSYVPRPSILTSPGIASYSDSRLFRSMLTGTGHEPVLERVVDSESRWYIVLYIRSFKDNL